MGESLIGRLKGVLAKKPATEASLADEPALDPPALDQPPTATPEAAADRTASVHSTGPVVVPQDPLLPSPAPSNKAHEPDQLVPIEFRALVPDEAAAREIAEVSRRGSDCSDAAASPSGRSDLAWQVLVTLTMIPKPEAIRDTVELVALFSSRLGGRADGWQMRERPGSGYLT
jgi:Regulator of ribonuclease activity B